ncbi:MAG TPA: hypothetical protein VK603_08880 [Candidatus Saccharimonadales bacterium]|nr:hypothetical protein [Candidatus Saccharimonadales bacterium]
MNLRKLKADFELLRAHCIIIRRNYNTYKNLFFSGNNELLMKAAWRFFNDIAEIMRRDWILQVCKLMDPSESKVKGVSVENISIDLIDSQLCTHGLMSPEILTVSNELREYGKKLIPARNKRLAHFDREHQLNSTVLGETTEEELFCFLVNIQRYCDFVGNAVGTGPLHFAASGSRGDELDLIRVLRERYEIT